MVLGSLLYVTLFEQWGWTTLFPEIPSNLNSSVHLCQDGTSVIQKLKFGTSQYAKTLLNPVWMLLSGIC